MVANYLGIRGGDTVRLYNGKVVKVYDIHNGCIVVSFDEHYPFEQIAEIVERFH